MVKKIRSKVQSIGAWSLLFIIPAAVLSAPILGWALDQVAEIFRTVAIPAAIILIIVLFAGTLIVPFCKKLQPQKKGFRAVVLGFCKAPWVVRLIASVVVALLGTYFLKFWTRELADFVSREINVTAVLLSVGGYFLAGGKVPSFKKKTSTDEAEQSAEEPDPSTSTQNRTMDEVNEEVQSEFNPDVGETEDDVEVDTSDLYEDDELLC